MYIHRVLPMSQLLSLAFAQQKCYWPNESSLIPNQGVLINCRANEDSNCCHEGEVCISDGLCFGSAIGMVRSNSLIPNVSEPCCPNLTRYKPLIIEYRYIEVPAQSKIGVIQLLVQTSGAMIVSSSPNPISLLNGPIT